MTKDNKSFIQMTTRVYNDRNPRLYHLLEQINCSHSDLLTMLAEQAIKMGGLEDVHPRDILNGTCYSECLSRSDNGKSQEITTSQMTPSQNSVISKNEADTELSDGIRNLGIMK